MIRSVPKKKPSETHTQRELGNTLIVGCAVCVTSVIIRVRLCADKKPQTTLVICARLPFIRMPLMAVTVSQNATSFVLAGQPQQSHAGAHGRHRNRPQIPRHAHTCARACYTQILCVLSASAADAVNAYNICC